MRTLLVLLLSSVAALAQPVFPPAFWAPAPVSGPTCSTSAGTTYTGTSTDGAGNSNTHEIAGNSYTNVSAASVCRVDFKLAKAAGTIVGKTYTVKFYSFTGSGLGTLLGTSSAVAGNDSWSATMVRFDFPTPVTLSANTRYNLVITCGSFDASNYINVYYSTISGLFYQTFKNDLSLGTSNTGLGLAMSIFYTL